MAHPMIGEPPRMVAVPTHFFKVVLAERNSNAGSAGELTQPRPCVSELARGQTNSSLLVWRRPKSSDCESADQCNARCPLLGVMTRQAATAQLRACRDEASTSRACRNPTLYPVCRSTLVPS